MSFQIDSRILDQQVIAAASSYPGWDIIGSKDESDIVSDEKMAALTSSKIRSLYDSGYPVFTRKALQDLHSQLNNTQTVEETVRVTGLDGVPVLFEIETGRTFRIGRSDLERVVVAPFIRYVPTRELMMHSEHHPYIPRLAYCNIRIQHQRKLQNRVSGGSLSPSLPPQSEVSSYFCRIRDTWNNSQACTRLRTIIESARPPYRKVIGFALGSMSWELKEAWVPRSAFQHALLLSLRNAMPANRSHEKPIKCFAQDPAYTEGDRGVLADSDVMNARDPEGFLQLDESSAVVSCSPDVPIKEVISELAFPALIIWDTVKDSPYATPSTDPDSPRVCAMLQANYNRLDFPGEHTYFGDLSIYIRRW